MAKKLGHSRRAGFFLKTMVLGLTTLLAAIDAASAMAEDLRDLRYDEATRSLTLVLSQSVIPRVSVLAPDQLLLELPDTQVGDFQTQSVEDGLVENIVLEQATPETTWVVMEFAAGTVLSESQSAALVAEADSIGLEDGNQAWQVRPAITVASRQSSAGTVAATPGASARNLRPPVAEIAQAQDFPELPVLEPAVPTREPVSVPPLDRSDSVPAVSIPTIESAPSGLSDVNAIEVEVILPTAETAAVNEPIPSEPPFLEPAVDSVFEPPFISEDELAAEDELLPNSVVPPEPIFIDLEVADEPIDEEVVATDSVVPVVEATEDAAAESRVAIGRDMLEAEGEMASESMNTADETALIEPVIVEPAIVEPMAVEPMAVEPLPSSESVQSGSAGRWPEPIPFGQPLPR